MIPLPTIYSVRAVMFGVMTAGFGMMFFSVAGMPMGAMRMMGCLFVIAGLMMLGSLAVMLCRVFVVFGGLVVMMFGTCVIGHIGSPGSV